MSYINLLIDKKFVEFLLIWKAIDNYSWTFSGAPKSCPVQLLQFASLRFQRYFILNETFLSTFLLLYLSACLKLFCEDLPQPESVLLDIWRT